MNWEIRRFLYGRIVRRMGKSTGDCMAADRLRIGYWTYSDSDQSVCAVYIPAPFTDVAFTAKSWWTPNSCISPTGHPKWNIYRRKSVGISCKTEIMNWVSHQRHEPILVARKTLTKSSTYVIKFVGTTNLISI